MEVAKSMKNNKDKIEYLLQTYPECRDDDVKLYFKFLGHFYPQLRAHVFFGIDSVAGYIAELKDAPHPETVRRMRAKFQQQGKYLGTKRRERLMQQDDVKDFLKTAV